MRSNASAPSVAAAFATRCGGMLCDGGPASVSQARNAGASGSAAGRPALGVRTWSDVLFPYDPAIPVEQRVTASDVRDRDDLRATAISETYACDGDGVISVRVSRPDGQSRSFEIFRA